jgi:hypothetical protein
MVNAAIPKKVTRAAIAVLCAGVVLAAPRVTEAQLVPAPSVRSPSVIAGASFEPEPVVSTAYLQPLPIAREHASLAAGAGAKLPPLSIARGDFRVQLLVAGGYQSAGGWGGACQALPYLARAGNDAGTLYGLGFELRCQPSYSRGGWVAGLDLGWQETLGTHVQNSDLARRTFDDRYLPGVTGISGPEDGWYRFTSVRFRAGLAASRRFGGWSGAVALGTLFTLQDQGVYLPLLPFYIELSARYGR